MNYKNYEIHQNSDPGFGLSYNNRTIITNYLLMFGFLHVVYPETRFSIQIEPNWRKGIYIF